MMAEDVEDNDDDGISGRLIGDCPFKIVCWHTAGDISIFFFACRKIGVVGLFYYSFFFFFGDITQSGIKFRYETVHQSIMVTFFMTFFSLMERWVLRSWMK